VYRAKEIATDDKGNPLANSKFRQGDVRFDLNEAKKVVQVLAYTSKNPWRYILFGLPNVSYAEAELLPAKEKEETHIIKRL